MNACSGPPDAWIERSDYDQPPNPDDACMVCDQIDCVCPPDSDFDSLDIKAESPNESTETDGDLSKVESLTQWLDAKGDALADPTSFDEWLRQTDDSI